MNQLNDYQKKEERNLKTAGIPTFSPQSAKGKDQVEGQKMNSAAFRGNKLSSVFQVPVNQDGNNNGSGSDRLAT